MRKGCGPGMGLALAVALAWVACEPLKGASDVQQPADTLADSGGDDGTETRADAPRDAPVDSVGDAGHDDLPGEVQGPSGCCEDATKCAVGAVCLGLEYGSPGTCWSAPAAGKCFHDTDCAEGRRCLGEHVTNCMMNSIPVEGDCLAVAADCCRTTLDCAQGLQCGSDLLGGPVSRCKEPAPEGRCWTLAQCGLWQQCSGASVCPCGAMCDSADVPGTCTLAAGCCDTVADCGAGEDCVDLNPTADTNEPFACKPKKEPGSCWTSTDCASDAKCVGATPCPCDMPDLHPDCNTPGSCQKKLPAGCCADGTDCDAGQRCLDPTGTCVAALQADQCYSDKDCALNQACLGATFCGCGEQCKVGTQPGRCQPPAVCGTAPDAFAGLAFDLETGGGFTGLGSNDVVLDSGSLKVTPPGGSACSACLTPSQYADLLATARAVDWAAVPATYVSPQNPSCCCDQFTYQLAVTVVVAEGGTVHAGSTWCDESLMGGTMPAPLLQFLQGVQGVATAVLASCTGG